MAAHRENIQEKRIGFIVNPVAGMGGTVGLKGTDGELVLKRAISLGAKPISKQRAETFLHELKEANDLHLLVGAGEMGEFEAKKCGLSVEVIGKPKEITTSIDTQAIAKHMLTLGVNLLVFCGGDGTARQGDSFTPDAAPA